MAPVVVDIKNSHCRLMRDEIFGPLLPVVSMADHDAAINHVKQAANPLAVYLFNKNHPLIDTVADNVTCGG